MTLLACAGLALSGLILGAGAASAAPLGTVITTAHTPWGTALVVGSGPEKGFSLYDITSDNSPSSFGCTTTVLHLGGQSLSCTGPPGDHMAVWPAITTAGSPVAAGGVHQNLLGTVSRPGVGRQVTYAGHPLYTFDDAPSQVNGEGFDDPASPLPHGVWFLVRPNGNQLPWVQTLTTVTIGGHRHLAAEMITLAGWVRFPLYTAASCPVGACTRIWPEVLSQGSPGSTRGVRASQIGRVHTALGTQLTYRGHPLYLFAQEQLNFTTFLAAGSGNHVGGFTFANP
jgi:predicted lipoprotein with Yx(FWY)xxD motif